MIPTGPRWVLGKKMGQGMIERHGDRPPRELTDPAFTITGAQGGSGGCWWLRRDD